jgi:broad specificity phosphatase PhoE
MTPRSSDGLLRIVVVRHGRPTVHLPSRIRPSQMRDVFRRYNAAGIDRSVLPPVPVQRLARTAGRILASDLPRAMESARMLAPRRRVQTDRVFREAGLPTPRFGSGGVDPALWGTLLRLLWFMGWAPNGESVARARARATEASRLLAELSEREGSVLLVGHGIFNSLLAWELCDQGWAGPRLLRGAYWSFGVYERAG